jgi:hypothetical protein
MKSDNQGKSPSEEGAGQENAMESAGGRKEVRICNFPKDYP